MAVSSRTSLGLAKRAPHSVDRWRVWISDQQANRSRTAMGQVHQQPVHELREACKGSSILLPERNNEQSIWKETYFHIRWKRQGLCQNAAITDSSKSQRVSRHGVKHFLIGLLIISKTTRENFFIFATALNIFFPFCIPLSPVSIRAFL